MLKKTFSICSWQEAALVQMRRKEKTFCYLLLFTSIHMLDILSPKRVSFGGSNFSASFKIWNLTPASALVTLTDTASYIRLLHTKYLAGNICIGIGLYTISSNVQTKWKYCRKAFSVVCGHTTKQSEVVSLFTEHHSSDNSKPCWAHSCIC